jgi:putative aminopeptidase FrvX
MGTRELLIELAEASGVSGHEEPVRQIVVREMAKYANEVSVTKLGSVVGIRYADGQRPKSFKDRSRPGSPRLMLEAHMDEIGLVVTGMDRGFIRFTQIGGYDVRVLPSQNVIVHGREELPGVIGSRPPHVQREDERSRVTLMADLFIDVGLPDSRARELVTVWDVITLDRKVTALRNDYMAGKGFDDRTAVAVIIDALRQLGSLHLQWDVYVVANVQEEDGAWYAGAATSAFRVHPDVAVVLDVSHGDQPGIGDVNVVPLDKGPGIALGPNIHPLVHGKLVQIAQAQEIPHRITAYSGPTGTDAWAIQIIADGIPTGLIDLPLRYMHSSVETVALNDLERSSRLAASFAAALDDEFYRKVKSPPPVKLERHTLPVKRSKKKQRR